MAETNTELAISSMAEAQQQMQGMATEVALLCNDVFGTGHREQIEKFLGPAIIYKQRVLPSSIATMQTMKDILEYYKDLNFEDWQECLDLLKEDAQRGHDAIQDQKQMYKTLLNEIDAKTIEMEKMAKDVSREAKIKEKIAFAQRIVAKTVGVGGWVMLGGLGTCVLAANPVTLVGAAGYALLYGGGVVIAGSSHEFAYEVYSDAKNIEKSGKELGALVVRLDGLLEKLMNFTRTITCLAGFFANLLSEVKSLQDAVERAEPNVKTRAKAHYIKIRNKARLLHQVASSFIAAVPMVQIQLRSIPCNPEFDALVIEYFPSPEPMPEPC